MRTKPNDNDTDESIDGGVEVYTTDLKWKDGRVHEVQVNVEYFGPDGGPVSENTVLFDVDETGEARPTGFETPIDTLDGLRVLPAAQMVARTAPGVERVVESFHVLEEQLNAGHAAVSNRLEKDRVPEDLRAGYDRREDEGE